MFERQLPLFDAAQGKARRDAALESFEVTSSEWLSMARSEAVSIAESHGSVTSDAVLAAIGLPPEYIHPNVIGAIFNDRRFRRIGVTPSGRPRNNASIIGVWALAML